MNITEEIAMLQHQIELVKAESNRLTQGEWALLMMLEHSVKIVAEMTRQGENR